MKVRCMPSGVLGANTYIAADEDTNKAFILDPGGYNKATEDYIRNEGYDPEYIIITHGHGDHTSGIRAYQKAFPGIKLVACEKEKEFLANPEVNLSIECAGEPISYTADIWVNDGDTMMIGNTELKFIHTPGHTPGGMCVLAGDILFSGDTLFYRSVGRTDFYGGSYEQLKSSVRDKLFLLPDDTKVYPGHMNATTIGEEKRENLFV